MKKKVNSGQSNSSDIGCEDFSCLEAAHETIFVVDSAFHFIKGNKAFQKFIHPYIGKNLSRGESLHIKGMPASLISQWEDGFEMVFKKKKAVSVDVELATSSFTGYFAYTLSPVFSENEDIKAVLFIGRPVERADKLKAILGVGNKLADYTQQDIEAVKQLADLTWDIAEHKKSEEQLRANEKKFRTLFENLSQGILYKAADGKIIDANEAALSMFGLTRSQLLGKDAYDKCWKIVDEDYRIIPPEQHPTVIALKTGKPVKDQTLGIYIPEEDRYNWVILNAFPQFLPDEKAPCQVFASMQDITKRKLAEESLKEREAQLHEINEQKDKFFSIIAHDLKSPFGSIVGFSELLDEKVKQKGYDGIDEYARIIKQSSHRVMDLLTNMLDWASSHTGRIQFEPKKHDLGELIMETMNDTEDLYSEKTLTVYNGILPGHSIVTADRNMLATVLRNLLTNAIKFSVRNGKIFISAIIDDNEIVVSVKDHGVGMPADRLKKLFVIGESESTPGTNNEHGTGLGLLICKEFIDKHNGRIWAESEEGRGSVFSFALPLNK